MNTWMILLLILAGLALLKYGAGWFVDGSSILARKMGISQLTIGITVVAFGTSAPELTVNIFASIKGTHDIVFGNIIGSNLFNLFLILSIVGLMVPLKVQSSTAWREIPFSLFAAVLVLFLANDTILFHKETAMLSRLDGLIMLVCFVLFLFYVYKQLGKEKIIEEETTENTRNIRIILLIIIGLAGLVIGGKLVLENAVKLAVKIGMSEKIIGLTIVAAGTSLPELATSIVAALKKNNDIAVGNIIGSNIFNILLILSASALINPLQFNTKFNFDILVLSGGTVMLLLAMYTGKKKQVDRWEAFILLGGYIAYILFMIYNK